MLDRPGRLLPTWRILEWVSGGSYMQSRGSHTLSRGKGPRGYWSVDAEIKVPCGFVG